MIVKANQFLLPKELLNITDKKYFFNVTLFLKIKIFSTKNIRSINLNFINKIHAFLGNDFK